MGRLSFILLVSFLTGCSMMVKTPIVANYQNLEKINEQTKTGDVAVLLGTPQGSGAYGAIGEPNGLKFYFGFAGEVSGSGMDWDYGAAFISAREKQLVDVIYYRAQRTGKPIAPNKNVDIKAIRNTVIVGLSTIDDLIKAIGPTIYSGKRLNFASKIDHQVSLWDASDLQPNGAIKEKWLLVGYDTARIVRDILWVSSSPEDIKAFGDVSDQGMKQTSRWVIAGYVPILEPTGLETGGKLDATQVDALLQNKPQNVKDIIKVLGLPSALGVKSFMGGEPMSLSNWSFSKVEIRGQEHNFIPPNSTEEQRATIEQSSPAYTVIAIEQTRLMVGHTADGQIKEILWVRPPQK